MMAKGNKVIMISYYAVLVSGSYITGPCECAPFELLILKMKVTFGFKLLP